MRVHIFMRSRENLYAFTSSENGANLPTSHDHGGWERQGSIDLHTSKPTDIGLDSEEVLRDIQKDGYHIVTVTEMLRRQSQGLQRTAK